MDQAKEEAEPLKGEAEKRADWRGEEEARPDASDATSRGADEQGTERDPLQTISPPD
jgi:hypothetical protein